MAFPTYGLLASALAIVVIGVWLRIRLLDAGSLWLDELWTLDAVSRSFKEMVGARLVSDQSPPLWTILTWLWLRIVRTYDVSAMRSLSVTCSLFAVMAPLVGGVRWPQLRPTLITMGALFAASLFAVHYAVELRNFSFAMACGSIATVIWAGLLSGQTPAKGKMIFAFSLSGALGGFAHYYGNLLYASLLCVLLISFVCRRQMRAALLLLAWGGASLVPVVTWFFATRKWAQNLAVAPPPSMVEIKHWLQYAFAPATNLIARQAIGYPDGTPGTGLKFTLALISLVALAMTLRLWPRTRVLTAGAPQVAVGAASLLVVLAGISMAWIISLLLPSSMNVRNLATLLPVLYLMTAAAVTSTRSEIVRAWTALIVCVSLLASVLLTLDRYGVSTMTPPWQQSAGYRGLAKYLLQGRQSANPPRMIGIQQPWRWHGDVAAALRAESQAQPTSRGDDSPLPIIWLDSVNTVQLASVAKTHTVVFGYAGDGRTDQLIAWAQGAFRQCEERLFGDVGYGNIRLADCSGTIAASNNP